MLKMEEIKMKELAGRAKTLNDSGLIADKITSSPDQRKPVSRLWQLVKRFQKGQWEALPKEVINFLQSVNDMDKKPETKKTEKPVKIKKESNLETDIGIIAHH